MQYNTATSVSEGFMPILYCAVDDNDSARPTMTELQEYQNVHMAPLNRSYKRTFYPKSPLDPGATAKIVSDSMLSKHLWVSSTSGGDVVWNGIKLKIYFQDIAVSYDYPLHITFKCYYECKNIK